MFRTIYIEEAVASHPRTQATLARFGQAQHIPCVHYGEVFNRAAQNFRLQKRQPSLILAEKRGQRVLPTPAGYGIGSLENFYFSHMLNCLYDCRYCFLQGMYRSAHMVIFINYEDFYEAIDSQIQQAVSERPYFFSGYDCDSLALEGITDFTKSFIDFFSQRTNATLELRTKSVRIHSLLARTPLDNCVVAFSLTPSAIADGLEVNTPPVTKRIEALGMLADRGWPIGLRFDPLLYHRNWRKNYRNLFKAVFARLRIESLHSVSLGQFRLPQAMYKRMHKLYPDEPLFAWGLAESEGQVSYRSELAGQLHSFCRDELLQYIDPSIFFPCPSTTLESDTAP